MLVNVKWLEKSAFAARSESNHWIVMDSSYNGGYGAAPTPVEYVLMGLGGCTGIDVVSILKKMRQEVTDLRMEIEGERAKEHPGVLTRIHVTYRVKGRHLDPSKVREAIELSDEEYCSISAMLKKTAQYSYDVEIESGD